jgi:hypothetical protein
MTVSKRLLHLFIGFIINVEDVVPTTLAPYNVLLSFSHSIFNLQCKEELFHFSAYSESNIFGAILLRFFGFDNYRWAFEIVSNKQFTNIRPLNKLLRITEY